MSEDTTPHGDPIIRHKAADQGWAPSADSGDMEAITQHIAKHLGEPANVWHELVSDIVHIDVHVVAPTKERPFFSLITSGMSDLPMSQPAQVEGDFRFAELMLCLPPDWPLDQTSFKDQRNYWPIYWLKSLARLPHQYQSWLWWGHSVPNGDPAEPLAPGCPFTGFVLMHPMTAPEEFLQLELRPGKRVSFLAPYPVYPEEMDLKLKEGADAVFEKFVKTGVTEVVNVRRSSVLASKPWWKFGR